jgi:hypothetical protein
MAVYSCAHGAQLDFDDLRINSETYDLDDQNKETGSAGKTVDGWTTRPSQIATIKRRNPVLSYCLLSTILFNRGLLNYRPASLL